MSGSTLNHNIGESTLKEKRNSVDVLDTKSATVLKRLNTCYANTNEHEVQIFMLLHNELNIKLK